MGVDMSDPRLRLPKGEKRATTKQRKDRGEALIKKLTRAACVLRDGHCRVRKAEVEIYGDGPSDWLSLDWSGHICAGESEWAHFGKHKRARTRGQAADIRHTTAGSLMLCAAAHRAYDAGTLQITALTRKGCEGRLKFRWSKSK